MDCVLLQFYFTLNRLRIRTSEITTEYFFFKNLERIVFMALVAVETMRFLLLFENL